MKYEILFILGILLVLPLVNAGLIFEKNLYVDITTACILDGFQCNSSATCNITSQFPNTTYLINNQPMTNLGTGDFNYSTTFTELGTYPTKVGCQQGTENETVRFPIKVTQTGTEPSTSEGIIYMAFLMVLIFVFLITLFGSIYIPWSHSRDLNTGQIISVNDLRYLKIVLIVMDYLLLMFIFGMTRGIAANFLFMEGLSNVFNWLYWLMFSFLWPGLVLALIITIITFLNNLKFKEALDRNIIMR